jgi:hypothetical protein
VSAATTRRIASNAAVQASLAGGYAWAVAVAPLAWAPGSSGATKLGIAAALLALTSGVVGERWAKSWVRPVSLWGFVLASAFTWSTFPIGLGIARIDPVRGVSGMLAWALYALAYAAPAMEPIGGASHVVSGAPLAERRKLPARDRAYVLGGTLVAIALQLPGWSLTDPGRALLMRLLGVASGLVAIGIATDLAARHNALTAPRRRRRRWRIDPDVVLTIVVVVGLVIAWCVVWFPGSGGGART